MRLKMPAQACKIGLNLSAIKQRIGDYEKKYSRPTDAVKLLAVSKSQSIEKIIAAYSEGQHAFGENYLQEALVKIRKLPTDIEWHFIGTIQSNKTKMIAENFDWVQSITSVQIAKRLNDQRPAHLPPLNICIEVNISDENTKAGIRLKNVLSLANVCVNLPHLRLRGLMTIPFPNKEMNLQRLSFQQLYQLYQSLLEEGLSLDTLSMGMSDDFEAAIAEGSTMVRIGTALFGERKE
jgi:pyridoxal phosphate enzyme (YggS family)